MVAKLNYSLMKNIMIFFEIAPKIAISSKKTFHDVIIGYISYAIKKLDFPNF